MIERLLSQSRTTEVSDVLNLILAAYRKSALSTDVYLSNLAGTLEVKSTMLSEAIKRLKVYSDLEAQDEIRDNAVRALFFLVNGAAYNPDAAVKAAAEQILPILENHGLSLVDESYATESALLNSLLLDLADASLEEAITTISGCLLLIDRLQSAQSNFEKVRLSFESSKAAEGQLANATKMKNDLAKLINTQLVGYLVGMELSNEAVYGEFARTVNQLISDNNVIVKKRRAAAKTEAASA